MFQDILQVNLISLSKKLNFWRRLTFQQVNDPKHTSKVTLEGLAWPSKSPNLDPIEHIFIKRTLVIFAKKNGPQLNHNITER